LAALAPSGFPPCLKDTGVRKAPRRWFSAGAGLSCGHCCQFDYEIIAPVVDRFQDHELAPVNHPFIVLFEQKSTLRLGGDVPGQITDIAEDFILAVPLRRLFR
jgi:hypothetical protein